MADYYDNNGVVLNDWRPSRRLFDVLYGRVSYEDVDPSIQSLASKYIFEAAREILAMKTKEQRRQALSKIPDKVRPHVEREILRLWSR